MIAALASIVIPAAILIGGFTLNDRISVNNWDNLESYVPNLWFTHQHVLAGEIPYWNQHQDLGRPEMAQGWLGVFYPLYTFSVWLADVSGLGQQWMLAIIVVLHSGIAGLGLHCVARDFGVQPVFALIASLGAVLGGNMIYVGSIWCFVVPYLGWYTWSIWGLKRLIDMRTPVVGFIVATVAMAMMFHLGHSEWAFRSWVALGLFSLGYALVKRCLIIRAGWLVAVAIIAMLLTMPTVFPLLEHLGHTERNTALSFKGFSASALIPEALIGLLLPVYEGHDGFFRYEKHLCTLYQGAWLAPALIAALVFSVRSCLNGTDSIGEIENNNRRKCLFLLTALGVLFVWLSLGPHGGLHSLTYGIPVWSRFRWPFKIFDRAIPFLAIAGAIALEMLSRRPVRPGVVVWFVVFTVSILVLWIVRPAPIVDGSLIAGIAGVVSVLLLLFINRAWARCALLAATVIGAVGVMILCHHPGRYKHSNREPIGGFTAETFGIDRAWRVLPLSPDRSEGDLMQELSLFESATMNGYYSATGARHALSRNRLNKVLPSSIYGLTPRDELPFLLRSYLLRSFNVRYLIVAKYDTDVMAFISQHTNFKQISATENALVYSNDDALPRAYFATVLRAHDDVAVRQGLYMNHATLTTAYVQGATDTGAIATGTVAKIDWQQNRVAIDVDAPMGGYLVISMNHDENWTATIDGQPTQLHLTNGTLTGVSVPPGASRIELVCHNAALLSGMYMALAGLVVGFCVAFFLSHVTSRASRSSPTEVDGDD